MEVLLFRLVEHVRVQVFFANIKSNKLLEGCIQFEKKISR